MIPMTSTLSDDSPRSTSQPDRLGLRRVVAERRGSSRPRTGSGARRTGATKVDDARVLTADFRTRECLDGGGALQADR